MLTATPCDILIITSLSSRRAWIEIKMGLEMSKAFASRSPRGGRGLKFIDSATKGLRQVSLSSRRAWIEIAYGHISVQQRFASLSSRRAWIEMVRQYLLPHGFNGRSPRGGRGLKCSRSGACTKNTGSLSSRRAWIEI